MNRFILLMSFTYCCFGYQSLNLPANASVKLTIPNASPFTALGDYRIAFRLHNWTLPGSGQATLISFGKATVVLNSNGQLCGFDLADTMASFGNATCVSITSSSDVVVRIQRFGSTYPVHDPSPGSLWIEAQDLGSGNILPYSSGGWANTGAPIDAANTVSFAGTANPALGSTVGFSLAWLKWFSSTVAPGSPMENEGTPAELADWRFEGNYLNQGTGGYAVALSKASGSPGFSGSLVKPPACNLRRQIFRAGISAQLSNTAYPLDGSAALQYLWQQLSGPTQLTWTGQNTGQPNVTGGVFGSYTLQLAVTDGSGQTSTCSIKDGFVATDANGIVVTSNPSVDVLLGPQYQLGKNPWGWFDDRHIAEAALQTANLATYYNLGGTPPWNTAGPGTITMTNKSAIVIGSGTAFLSTFCAGGNSPPPQGSILSIWYPLPAVREGSGRRLMQVASCQSDTQLTLASPWNNMGFLTAGSGWNYAWVDGNVWNTWFANAAPANFYDVVAALYSLYYRSGIDDYLNTARLFADNFWQFRLDSGRNYFYGEGYNTFPRNRSVLGMVLRALDGRPDMWSGLELIANLNISSYHATFQNYGPWTQIQGDPRENGYELMEEAYCALFDPNASPAAACRAGISELITNGYTSSRFPDGNWYSLYWGGMGGGPASVKYASWASGVFVSTTNGSPSVTCVNGTGTCNWTPDLFVSGSSPQVWWFLNSTTSAPNSNADGDPVAYYPSYVDASHLVLKDINGNTVGYQGTTGNHGWAIGYGGAVGFAVQPYMLGILATAFDFAAKAMTCTGSGTPARCDNAVATNAHAYNVQAANYLRKTGYWPATKGMWYFAGSVNCTPPVSDANVGCTGGNNAGAARILNAEALRGVMTAYAYNGDPDLLAFGDTLFTAMWGRPGFSLPDGQAGDGQYMSGFNDGFGWFMTGAPPVGTAHKYFGMGWGISAGSAWPGYRIGGAQIGSIMTNSIMANLASVPQAVAFNVLLTYATGATATIQCGASPCTISYDQSVGNPAVQIQYLSASGAVLATQPYSSPLPNAESLALPPGKVFNITVPSAAPFPTLSDTRLEFRLHNWTTPTQDSTILALGGSSNGPLFSIQLTPSNELCALDWVDVLPVYGNRMCADITGVPDVVARVQRDTTNKVLNYEVRTVANTPLVTYCGLKPSGLANQFGCPMQTVNLASWAGFGEIGDSASVATLRLAWIKWYSTLVSPGSGSLWELVPADLADWRFEGSTDEAAAGVVATIQGEATYAPKPVYPPVCVAGLSQTLRAGYQAQLDGSASYPLDEGTTLTYSWQQLSGPSRVTWLGANSAGPTVSHLVSGSYMFQLAVTDGNNQSTNCTVKDGAVASDDNAIVITHNAALDLLTGSRICYKAGSWPWFDRRPRAAADLRIKNLDVYHAPYGDTPARGSVTANSAIMTGAGAAFTTKFCQALQNPNLVRPGNSAPGSIFSAAFRK